MPILTALTFARKYGWILAVVLLGWWLHHQSATIASQATSITKLSKDLKDESAARTRDVAALTTLSTGLVAASSAKAADQKALTDAIDIRNPQPVSAGLGNLLQCLRDHDNGKTCTGSTGSTPAK